MEEDPKWYSMLYFIAGVASPEIAPVSSPILLMAIRDLPSIMWRVWNESEEKIVYLYNNNTDRNTFLSKYIENSSPKIGWDDKTNINHFKLVELIADSEFGIKKEAIVDLFSEAKMRNVLKMIDTKFEGLVSKERMFLIKLCLEKRQQVLLKIISEKK